MQEKNRLKFIFSYRLIVQQRQKGKELEWADEYGGFFGGPSRRERPGDSHSGGPSSLCGIGTLGRFVGCSRSIRTKEIYSSDKMSATNLLSLEGVFPDYRYLSDLRSTNPIMPPALRAISGTVPKNAAVILPSLSPALRGKKTAVCHNSQSAALLSDLGLVMYFSTLPAPSSFGALHLSHSDAPSYGFNAIYNIGVRA